MFRSHSAAVALLLESRSNVDGKERVNSKVLRVDLVKHTAAVYGWLVKMEICLGHRALQPGRVKALCRKAAFHSVSGTSSRWSITWRCIIYAIVLWGLWIPKCKKHCMTQIDFFHSLRWNMGHRCTRSWNVSWETHDHKSFEYQTKQIHTY